MVNTAATRAELEELVGEMDETFPYEQLERRGAGGMGVVYRAWEPSLGRHVALKFIRPALMEVLTDGEREEIVERFLREARAAAALNHPAITPVYRVGVRKEHPWIAMEWVDGETLEPILAAHRNFDIAQVARLGIAVAGALREAHRLGIVHRDIKPANLMRTHDRRVRLMDFGIAQLAQNAPGLTQAGAVMGTPRYASPEQLSAQPVDARSDLYSLAVVLYQMLTGRVPFDGDSPLAVAIQVMHAPLVLPSRWIADLDPALDTLFARLLSRDPAGRPTSAQEFSALLQPWVGRTTSPAAIPLAAANTSNPSISLIPEKMIHQPEINTNTLVEFLLDPSTERVAPTSDIQQTLNKLFPEPIHAAAFCGRVTQGNKSWIVLDGLPMVLQPAPVRSQEKADADIRLCSLRAELSARVLGLAAMLTVAPSVNSPSATASRSMTSGLPVWNTSSATAARDVVYEAVGADGRVDWCFFVSGKLALWATNRDFNGTQPANAAWTPAVLYAAQSLRAVEWPPADGPSVLRQLGGRGAQMAVTRQGSTEHTGLRVDTRENVEDVFLSPPLDQSAWDSTRRRLQQFGLDTRTWLENDPRWSLGQWCVRDAKRIFEQHGRSTRWTRLLKAFEQTANMNWDPPTDAHVRGGDALWASLRTNSDTLAGWLITTGSPHTAIDDPQWLHDVVQVMNTFSPGEATGGIIIGAETFGDAFLEAYLELLRSSQRRYFFGGLDALSHREGFLRVGLKAGYHILLVEMAKGEIRPLVFQE